MDNRLKILNIWVDPVNMAQALAKVEAYVEKGARPHTVFAVNPEKNFSVPQDRFLFETFKDADLLIPDGIGVVLAARVLHGAKLSRVPGADLMENICWLAAKKGFRIFIYGAKEEVSRKAAEELERRYPGLKIAGRANGYLKEADMEDLVNRINGSGAQILFLALGSPKQEQWFTRYRDRFEHVRVVQGIGGTLDTIAGNVKRAPKIWQKCSAEWLYRLLSEPKRIKRQKVLPIFAAQIFLEKVKKVFHRSLTK